MLTRLNTVLDPARLADARKLVADGRFVDGVLSAGEYRRTWDGRAASGERAAAGVYFARLEIGGFREVQRIVLLRSSP